MTWALPSGVCREHLLQRRGQGGVELALEAAHEERDRVAFKLVAEPLLQRQHRPPIP